VTRILKWNWTSAANRAFDEEATSAANRAFDEEAMDLLEARMQ
jgi:hypothetical protein